MSTSVAASVAARALEPFALARALLGGLAVIVLGLLAVSVIGLSPLASPGFCAGLCLAGLAMAALVSLCGARAPQARSEPGPTPLFLLGRIGLAAGVLASALAVAAAVWLPIGAYDALGYRLPVIAQWLDAGAWTWVSGDDPLRNGYPLGLELLEAALFAMLGSSALIEVVSSLFVAAGALSVLGLVRTLTPVRGLPELAAGLFLLVPMHLLNAPSGYADAAFAGAMTCMLIAVARAERGASWLDLGLAAGWTMALKPHGFAYSGLALLAYAWLRRRSLREAVWAGLVALPGLVFAARNVLRTGNPIYPLELRIGEHVLLAGEGSLENILTPAYNVPPQLSSLPGWLRAPWVWLQPYGPARSYDDRLAGFGYAFLLALPAMAFLCVRALRRRGPRAPLLLTGLTFACWALQPLSFWSRFSSWLWGAGAVAIALSVAQLIELGRPRVAVLLALASLLLALPEAAYALAHVKSLDVLGRAAFRAPATELLARSAKLDLTFLRRHLLGKRAVCRTPWLLGTDDANLDGVVAQLSPRPKLHVIWGDDLARAVAEAGARGCDALIVIGDSPLLQRAPSAWVGRIERARAFGTVSLIPTVESARASAGSYEVTP